MYTCPQPTKEQKELGTLLGYDPYDRCGDGITDTSACDPLCAACLIHDEMFLIGGSFYQWRKVNSAFERDLFILAWAADTHVEKIMLQAEAEFYVADVWMFSGLFWQSKDRNTPITRAQGAYFMSQAKDWINLCADKIGHPRPY